MTIDCGLSDLNEELGRILSNILCFCSKLDDAPMSAQAHLDKAIVDLVALCPWYRPPTDEILKIITDATDHIRLLGAATTRWKQNDRR